MADRSHTDDERPRSFHASPAEALEAPRERFLYLACLHEGTGVDEPDFIAVVDADPDSGSYGEIVRRDADAERRGRASPLRLEPLQLGLPRARPLAPDRARLPLVADPHPERGGRSAPATDREGDRAGGAGREDGLQPPPHRPLHAGRQRRGQHARRPRRRRRGRLRLPRRAHLRGQGPLGERRPEAGAQLRLLVPAAQERPHLVGVRRAERLRVRLRHRGRRRRPLRAAAALLGPRGAAARADPRPGRGRSDPARGALAARPRGRAGLRRGGAGQQHRSASTARTAASRPSP